MSEATEALPMFSETARPWTSRARRTDVWVRRGISAVGLTGIAAVLLIFLFVGREALPLVFDQEAREEVSVAKMFTPQVVRPNKPPAYVWQPMSSVPKVSMIPLFVGTLKLTLVALLFALPFALGAALFTSEFAPKWLREWLKPAIELLAGVPSVVLGFFALVVLADPIQQLLGLTSRLNALVAGLALGLAIVPVVFSVAEDALRAVPGNLREASLALGATRWQTALRVVLPAARSGVVAAAVLGMGRAIGETMIVLMASGNAAIVSGKLGDSARTMSATIAAEMGEVVVGSPHYAVLFFLGVELFAFTFLLNLVASAVLRKRKVRA